MLKTIFKYSRGSFGVSLFLLVAMAYGVQAHAETATDEVQLNASSAQLGDEAMSEKRGSGGGVTTNVNVVSDQTLNATSTGNTLSVNGNLTNGSIYTGNNFGGSGFGSYVMNTGNNTVINSGFSLSVNMMQ